MRGSGFNLRALAAVGAVMLALLVSASPALALSGNSSSGNAAAAQYTPSSAGGHGNTLSAGGSPGGSGVGSTDSGSPSTQDSTPLASASTSTAQGGLPFTGYALLTAVGIGLCLISVGAVVRRRARGLGA